MRAAGLAVLALLAGCSSAPPPSGRPPSIVLIVADDLGYAELSCQGGDIPTPNLDRLAASGVRYTAGYVTSPYCSPSRAGLLTGRHQQRFGHEINPVEHTNDRPEVGLPAGETTLADRLRAAGYRTGMSGKWHLGVHPPQHPLARGFDEVYGFLREGHFYFPPSADPAVVVSRLRPREPGYDRLNPVQRGGRDLVEPAYLTDAIGREAAAFIDRNAARPFFLYVPFNAPHSPLQAPADLVARFASIADPHRRLFAAMVASMDAAVGRVLDTLDRHGLRRDTIVIFLSDNGGPTKELTSRNDPFSGGKGSHREGGIRVPFLASWPARLPAGLVETRPVSALDVVPTALAAAVLPLPAGLDGEDLLRPGSGPRPLFWRMGDSAAVRRGRWKLLREKAGAALYDLETDAREERDRSAEHPEEAQALAGLLRDWERGLVPPLWFNEPR